MRLSLRRCGSEGAVADLVICKASLATPWTAFSWLRRRDPRLCYPCRACYAQPRCRSRDNHAEMPKALTVPAREYCVDPVTDEPPWQPMRGFRPSKRTGWRDEFADNWLTPSLSLSLKRSCPSPAKSTVILDGNRDRSSSFSNSALGKQGGDAESTAKSSGTADP